METNAKLGLLEAHGIECDVDEEGRTWAMEVYVQRGREVTKEWVDVSEWSASDLRAWLGY